MLKYTPVAGFQHENLDMKLWLSDGFQLTLFPFGFMLVALFISVSNCLVLTGVFSKGETCLMLLDHLLRNQALWR